MTQGEEIEIGGALDPDAQEQIRAGLEAQRKRPDRRSKGLLVVHTGDGKGKTTAALGTALRAWGRGMHVTILQFIKAASGNWGETRAAEKIGLEIVALGAGFTWDSKDIAHDRDLARQGWAACRAKIESGEYDVVVLDEMTYCFTYGWLDIEEVLGVLDRRKPTMHVIITGRDAPARLIEAADLVTEMREIKHPFKEGILAQPGIEF